MPLNKKSLLLLVVILLGAAILVSVYNLVTQSPKETVVKIMENIEEKKEVEELSNENQEKLQYFFQFSREKNLESPQFIIRDYPNRSDIITVTFEIIQNNKQSGVEAVYEGHADFSLTKQGLNWEVQDIEVTPYRKES
ncbi:hypothetical protein FZC78_07570 [Rossellomorea vietnamensis]|uniref:DUF4878 domain-containing protein n=1 Tax=Rossellomorea vietnamensis TaxID=218284 RepID=A0A5D4NVL3_9BACI|nr:hypothetical protein [Rossellomorea vietnamensis]TYS17711.1 hypothetical protein FZC78_07570 [Rossellomorea vietnamensis]